jgi:hypothetical protein
MSAYFGQHYYLLNGYWLASYLPIPGTHQSSAPFTCTFFGIPNLLHYYLHHLIRF